MLKDKINDSYNYILQILNDKMSAITVSLDDTINGLFIKNEYICKKCNKIQVLYNNEEMCKNCGLFYYKNDIYNTIKKKLEDGEYEIIDENLYNYIDIYKIKIKDCYGIIFYKNYDINLYSYHDLEQKFLFKFSYLMINNEKIINKIYNKCIKEKLDHKSFCNIIYKLKKKYN
jgi:hypothetical protein